MSDSNDIDPFRMMRDYYIKSEKMWSDALSDAMGTDQFSNSMGKYMQEAMHAQRMFSETMGQYLSNMNIPTRTEVLDMGDRLAQMDDKINLVLIELRALKAAAASADTSAPKKAAAKKPARTKKPPAKSN